MVNAIVACSVVLTLVTVYCLAKFPSARSRHYRHKPDGRIWRLLRIAIRRMARRDVRCCEARELERRP